MVYSLCGADGCGTAACQRFLLPTTMIIVSAHRCAKMSRPWIDALILNATAPCRIWMSLPKIGSWSLNLLECRTTSRRVALQYYKFKVISCRRRPCCEFRIDALISSAFLDVRASPRCVTLELLITKHKFCYIGTSAAL